MDYLRGRKKHGWGRGWFLTRSLISTRIRKHENLIIFQICFFYDFRAEEVLAKKGVQDLWHGKVLKSGSHSLKHEFQNSISSTYPDFQRNVFGRLVHTSQDGAEQHFPKYSLGNLRCTSRKGPCGQLIWVNLFFKISHLRIYYAHEHFNIPLPHKSIVHSALLLCFHVEGNQFLASWGGGCLAMCLAFVSEYARMLYTPYLSRSFKWAWIIWVNLFAPALCYEDTVAQVRDWSFSRAELTRTKPSQSWPTDLGAERIVRRKSQVWR